MDFTNKGNKKGGHKVRPSQLSILFSLHLQTHQPTLHHDHVLDLPGRIVRQIRN
jgi:hypothetical protein